MAWRGVAWCVQGSPEEQANASVRAAVRMLHDLDYCNTSAGLVNAETGIGINTGKVRSPRHDTTRTAHAHRTTHADPGGGESCR